MIQVDFEKCYKMIMHMCDCIYIYVAFPGHMSNCTGLDSVLT